MSLAVQCVRTFVRNARQIPLAYSKHSRFSCCLFQTTTNRSIHTDLAKLSATNSPNKPLKDSFNSKKAERAVEEDDEDDFDFKQVNNMQQLQEKVLRKYLKEESKHNAKLVYVGGLTSQLKMAKILSLSSRYWALRTYMCNSFKINIIKIYFKLVISKLSLIIFRVIQCRVLGPIIDNQQNKTLFSVNYRLMIFKTRLF